MSVRVSLIIDGDARSAIVGVDAAKAKLAELEQAARRTGGNAAQGLRLTNFELGNIQYQLQDMAVGLASGQSPFMIMMQQGSQISQLFGSGTGVAGALKEVGKSLVQFLTNPLNLAVIGFGAAATAATALFQAVSGSGAAAEAVLARHEELVKRIKGAYDTATGAIRAFGEETRRSLLFRAIQDRYDLANQLRGQLADLTPAPGRAGVRFGDIAIPAAQREIADLVDAFRDAVRHGKGDILAFNDELARIGISAGPGSPAARLTEQILAEGAVATETAAKHAEASRLAQGLGGNLEKLSEALGRTGHAASAATGGLNVYNSRAAQIFGYTPIAPPPASGQDRSAAMAASRRETERAAEAEARFAEMLRDRNAATALAMRTLGLSAREAAEATRRQELLNAAHRVFGDTLAPRLVQEIDAEAAAYGRLVAAQEAKRAADEDEKRRLAEQIAGLDRLRNAASGFLSTLTQAKEAGKSWGEALVAALDTVQQKLIELAEQRIIDLLFGLQGTSQGGLMGGLAGLLGSLFQPSGGGVSLYAAGGVFTNSVVSQPTPFLFGGGSLGVMGEKEPEAVMPLMRGPGGRLGVVAHGAGSGGGPVFRQEIHNYGPVEVESQARPNAEGGLDIVTTVRQIVDDHLGGGGADRVMDSRFGLKRRVAGWG